MATRAQTAEFLLEQSGNAGVSLRKMFGEYAVYCDGKVVGLLCDDCLFIKPIDPARAYLKEVTEGFPYPGAKSHFQLPPDQWEDADWLAGLFQVLAEALPAPKPKSPRKKR
ncbi:TfoX/Sxy family protein [Phaeovulum sp.]|uniref:TfoX/Sxy family protein n=1 Tax=Phaeovulum sp. TaxID=2934796 RepID=UPI0039E71CE2